jgi:hypothetical protein
MRCSAAKAVRLGALLDTSASRSAQALATSRTSDGSDRSAATLIQTAKLNGVDPQAWLTDVLERIVSGRTKAAELDTLLPWYWRPNADLPIAAAA